jgi:hypothetical protein
MSKNAATVGREGLSRSSFNRPKVAVFIGGNMRVKELSGKRFGRLVVKKRVIVKAERNSHWCCLCDCGKTTIVRSPDLTKGHTKSCGCLGKELSKTRKITHGKSYCKIYRIHRAMINRCHNPKNNEYKNYGGRGIIVCNRWKNSFLNFLHDMGDKPDGLCIERINNDGNYEPCNCKWASMTEQAHNRRGIKLSVVKVIEIRKLHLSGITSKQLAKNYGVDVSNIRYVLNRKSWL